MHDYINNIIILFEHGYMSQQRPPGDPQSPTKAAKRCTDYPLL